MREWLTRDLRWKAFSVLLATATWLIVHHNVQSPDLPPKDTTYGDLPVTPIFLQAGGRAKIDPAVVSVTVSGPSDKMATLQENEVCPQINLSGLLSGTDLQRSVEVAVPPGITVVNVDPPNVAVTVSPPPLQPHNKTNE